MVPLRLSLRNFMCYRNGLEPLDLSGIQVVCLSGDNGAGKTALLDAITWALWGRARAKSDDDLVHLGESEMEVELEFMAGEAQYRVIRKRAKGGATRRTGQSILELQVMADGIDGIPSYSPISGNSIRETQAQVQKILQLDYDTFINSAYLVQGRADEFTLKSPGDRKAVLGKVLDLEKYDRLEEKAREKVRGLGASILAIEADVIRKGQDLAFKESVQEQLAETQRIRQDLEKDRSIQDGRVALLKEKNALTETKRAQLTEAQRTKGEAEMEIASAERRIVETEKRAAEYREIITQAHSIEAGVAELESVRSKYTAMSQAAAEWAQLTQKKTDLESRVNQAKAQIMGEIAGLKRQKEGMQRAGASSVEEKAEQLREAHYLLETIDAEELILVQNKARSEEAAATVQRLATEQESAKREGQELRQKLDVFAHSGADAKCPLCESDLGAHGWANLKQHYEADIEDRRKKYREMDLTLKSAREEESRAKAEAERIEKRITEERNKLQVRIGNLQGEMEAAKETAARLQEVLAHLTSLEERLNNNQYAQEEQNELATVVSNLEALRYDPQGYEVLRQHLESLQTYEAKRQMLENARKQLPREEDDLTSAKDSLKRWKERFQDAQQKEALLSEELANSDSLMLELAQADLELNKTTRELAQLREEEGKIQGQLEYYRHLETELKRASASLESYKRERGLYEELTTAFGKRGVQALIIEEVLPQLEEEANQLLSRMTDNRMALRFETQRTARSNSDNIIETLDIIIGDELGTRPYELFSGGESFRINFALRVAMSKLLARRSGAPLPTLIIDEGFGSQDGPGRLRLVEAINAIQPDFQRILVITHVDELKDAFPVRIEVSKGPEGSTYVMV